MSLRHDASICAAGKRRLSSRTALTCRFFPDATREPSKGSTQQCRSVCTDWRDRWRLNVALKPSSTAVPFVGDNSLGIGVICRYMYSAVLKGLTVDVYTPVPAEPTPVLGIKALGIMTW